MASRRGLFCILAAIALWLCAWSSSVFAAPSASERETARSLMQDGDRLLSSDDPLNALKCYQAAHAIMRVPTTGIAVAKTQAQLGQLVEARSSALDVLSIPTADDEPAVFGRARDTAANLARSLESRVCTLKTRVLPQTAQYSLQIDDVALPKAARSMPFKTNPGSHMVRVRAPGYQAQAREIYMREGSEQLLEIKLIPEAQRERLQPEAQVAAEPQLSPGQAAYSLEQLDDARQGGRIRGWIGLGVGAAAVGVGIVTGYLSWTQTSDIMRFCGPDFRCDPSQASALRHANTLALLANITVPLGVVGLAYGLYELLTLPAGPRDSKHAGLQLDILPSAVVVRGRL
jgi:hypothetical protein